MALIILLALGPPSVAQAGKGKPSVVFLSPGAKDDAFFGPMVEFMKAAADDLMIDFEVIYGRRNHVVYEENARTLFKRATTPDYVIITNTRGAASLVLPLAERYYTKVVIINEGLHDDQIEVLGSPGKKFKQWIFQYLPDDTLPGYLLAKILIKAAKSNKNIGSSGTYHMAAIAGHKASRASTLRIRGLKRALKEHPEVRLVQVINADWKREIARTATSRLLRRSPEISMLWTASDLMATGVVAAAKGRKLLMGVDLFTGGIDWAPFAISAVQDGDFKATLGGHFMDGAWALVMIYDHAHGLKIPKTSYSTFSAITRKNVDRYTTLFGKKQWNRIDFTHFSRHLDPTLKTYDFSLDAVLKQAK